MSRPRAISSGPTTGTLFSAWQALTQALQPMQAAASITIAQAGSGCGWGGSSEGGSETGSSGFRVGKAATSIIGDSLRDSPSSLTVDWNAGGEARPETRAT